MLACLNVPHIILFLSTPSSVVLWLCYDMKQQKRSALVQTVMCEADLGYVGDVFEEGLKSRPPLALISAGLLLHLHQAIPQPI